MYYPYFISYMLAGLAIALGVFAWAMNNEQFKDQRRARFLPLLDSVEHADAHKIRVRRIEKMAYYALIGVGVCASAAVVIFALVKVK
jgi:nitrogen fixation-related uncharacterized protein